ncbi:MAG: hypothetical protein ACHREM_02245 [Polyangiales bacterium]
MSTRMSPLAWLLGAGAVGAGAWFVTRSKSAPQPRTAGVGAPHPFVSTGGDEPMPVPTVMPPPPGTNPIPTLPFMNLDEPLVGLGRDISARAGDAVYAKCRMYKSVPAFGEQVAGKPLHVIQRGTGISMGWIDLRDASVPKEKDVNAVLRAEAYNVPVVFYRPDPNVVVVVWGRDEDLLAAYASHAPWAVLSDAVKERVAEPRLPSPPATAGGTVPRVGYFETDSDVKGLDAQIMPQATAIDQALLSQAVRKYGPEGFATGLSAISADDMPEFIADRDFYRKWRERCFNPVLGLHQKLQDLYANNVTLIDSADWYRTLKKCLATLTDWRQGVEARGLPVRW